MIPKIKGLNFTDNAPFFLIAGPCVVEDMTIMNQIAQHLSDISHEYELPVIFKASYMKANRTALDSYMGEFGNLHALATIRNDFGLPVTSDFHSVEEIEKGHHVVDVIQIPAFLSRQTPLLVAAAKTGKWVNIKKGQFMPPHDALHAERKVMESGNVQVMLTERGTTFGYDDLVIDFRNIHLMKKYNKPVIVDVTHSLGKYHGDIPIMKSLSKAALAAGADGIFIETHPTPGKALSDGKRMLPLDKLRDFIQELI